LQIHGVAFGSTRIGVHCGDVVVGNFGGNTIFDYRAMGDAVNTAARLESFIKYLGTTMCVSGAIRNATKNIPMRPVGEVIFVGKSNAISVYEPLVDSDNDPEYEQAYALLKSKNPAARSAFSKLQKMRPQDGLVAFHSRRLSAGETGDLIRMVDK
ncbi:MAG: adenylate/guanylate cyclase domain-containing protein, partial [Herbaspirillum sp.]